MDFNIFVVISTVIFYVLLKIYKKCVLRQQKYPKQSLFKFVLFVPIILYISKYMYNIKVTQGVVKEIVQPTEFSKNSILSKSFPDSTV